MSIGLKEETLTALKTGVDFLEKVKIKLDSNELKRKLDEVHYIFEELVKKWESNSPKNTDMRYNKKKFGKAHMSAPILPPVRKEQEEKISKILPLKKNNSISTEETTSPTKKVKRTLFQQLRSRSKSEDNVLEGIDNNSQKKKLCTEDIVPIPLTDLKDDSGYLKLQGPDNNMIMSSNTNKFSKVTKIKLKVNNKAIGARYCCLSDSKLLLGRELNDQTAEYVLDLSASYRLKNPKSQYFELIKGQAIYSFRFGNETESTDWYNSIDNIIESQGVYSYVSLPIGFNGSSNEQMNMIHNVDTNDMAQSTMDKPLQPLNNVEYDYPMFVPRKPRAHTDFNQGKAPYDSVAPDDTYTYVTHDSRSIFNNTKDRLSLPVALQAKSDPRYSMELGVLFEDSFSTENAFGQSYEHKHRDILGKPKIPLKPKSKFARERSMST